MIKFGKNLFNSKWEFCLKDLDCELSESDKWKSVEIPHDWLIYDTKNLYKNGTGFYKRILTVQKEELGSTFYLCFDGVYMDSTLLVNGKEVGIWQYGYSAFNFEITNFLQEGDNEICVKVRYQSPNSRWYTGAGIFRDVWLVKKDKMHFLINGIYIAPQYNAVEDSWNVNIDAEYIGKEVKICHTIISAGNEQVGRCCAVISSEDEVSKSVMKLPVKNPQLWDIDSPVLYTLKSEIIVDGSVCDTVYDTFGFRTTTFSPTSGFKLNGKTVKLKGVCMHHDLGAIGSAVNKAAIRRQLTILQSFGANSVRTSHNMPSETLVKLCDEMGILLDSEGFDMWELPKTTYDYARFFDECYKKDVAAWVRRDRNHPSVIMWSIGNEILDTQKDGRGLQVAEMLSKAVTENDYYGNAVPTIASNYMNCENAQKVANHLKVVGYNYGEQLYDEHHKIHSDWFIYGSETASTVRSRGVYHMPADTPILTYDDMQCSDYGNSIVGWGQSNETAWIMDRDRSYCGGEYVWSGFDYIGEPTPYKSKNSFFGIVDTAGIPKDAYYFYKSVWTDGIKDPFVHIAPYWDFNDGEIIDVVTYSNVEQVELFFNGESVGKQRIDLNKGKILHGCFKVPYKMGTIEARVYDENGDIVATDKRRTPYEPTKISLLADRKKIDADGRDIAFIEISVLDKNGEPVGNARNYMHVNVSGCGRLVGLDNGDSTDFDSYKGTTKRLFGGKLVAFIESLGTSGSIDVTVSSKGLENGNIRIEALPCCKIEGISVVPMKSEDNDCNKIPVRKIELICDNRSLTNEVPSTEVTAKRYPENASFDDITWKCAFDTGIEANIATVTGNNNIAIVTATGDGAFKLMAMCNNDSDFPEIVSELQFKASGIGAAINNPYKFISASYYTISNKPLNTIQKGAVAGIAAERTVIGFSNVDFGKIGSNMLNLYFGVNDNDSIPVEIWLGDPQSECGELLQTVNFTNNGRWDSYERCDFELNKALKGVQTVSFVFNDACIFGGFSFTDYGIIGSEILSTSNSGIYGDQFRVIEGEIENIGNNVLIAFNAMNFASGAEKLTICGKTANESNTIQLRYIDKDGTDRTEILVFKRAEEYVEQSFNIHKMDGILDLKFVFMPGSNFDFKYFVFL